MSYVGWSFWQRAWPFHCGFVMVYMVVCPMLAGVFGKGPGHSNGDALWWTWVLSYVGWSFWRRAWPFHCGFVMVYMVVCPMVAGLLAISRMPFLIVCGSCTLHLWPTQHRCIQHSDGTKKGALSFQLSLFLYVGALSFQTTWGPEFGPPVIHCRVRKKPNVSKKNLFLFVLRLWPSQLQW